jgi:hypothetical protein
MRGHFQVPVRTHLLSASVLASRGPEDGLQLRAAWQEAAALLTLVAAWGTAIENWTQATNIAPYACRDAVCDCSNNNSHSLNATAVP